MCRAKPRDLWVVLAVFIALISLPSIACLGGSSLGEGVGPAQQPPGQVMPAAAEAPVEPTSVPSARIVENPTRVGPGTDRAPTPAASSSPAPLPVLAASASSTSQQEPMSVVKVSQLVRPAVVNISTHQLAYDWYLRPIPEERGSGSGVIFDQSGLILTNSHVVEGARGLTVALPDGRTFDGQIVGADPRSDLAVVRVGGQNLPVAELGDSDALQIGEQVVAIGNALALPGGPTVTTGIVGALGRSIREDNGAILYDLIQTDAAIDPGNSGGPLVNMRGQVVGINTAIANAPGGGIGFAIAINTAKPIAQQLTTQRRVVRPWMGVTFQNVTPGLAARFGLGVKKGVMIASIYRGTPAAKAGLRRGDIIVKFGEDQIDDDVAMLKSLARHGVGQTVPTVVVRDDKQIQIDITLEEMPAS